MEESTIPEVIHFEIHASCPEELINYYSCLLGWKFTKVDNMEYWLIETGTESELGINGGLLKRPGAAPKSGMPVNAFVCTVQVPNLDQALMQNEKLGGKVALPKMPVPGVGWLAYIHDLDGNILGLMQLDTNAK